MAFLATTWAPNDEVTSEKLSQMSDNDDWLKDNALTGVIYYMGDEDGDAPFGRTIGSTTAHQLLGIRVDFDSTIAGAATSYTFKINLPPIFTEAPIITHSMNCFGFCASQLVTGDRTDYCEILIYSVDGASMLFIGKLNLILMGV